MEKELAEKCIEIEKEIKGSKDKVMFQFLIGDLQDLCQDDKRERVHNLLNDLMDDTEIEDNSEMAMSLEIELEELKKLL